MAPKVPSRRKTLSVVNENSRVPLGGGTPDRSKKTSRSTKSRGRMSMAPRMAGGENNPRGSDFSPSRRDRRKSIIPPPTTAKTDPRPLTDKAYMNASIRTVLQFLNSNGYEYPVSHKVLTRPSGKDFSQVVTFLLRKVDHTFMDGTLKFEDEVSMAFKFLGYPFPISKTALVAAGAPHTWPTLLGALTWLVELLQCEEADVPEAKGEEGEAAAFSSLDELAIKSDKEFFLYLADAYNAFLVGDDKKQEILELELIDFFEGDNQVILGEVERLTDVNAGIVETVEDLMKRSEDLPSMEKKREALAVDLEKFHSLVAQMENHKATCNQNVEERTAEFKRHDEELEQVTSRVDILKEKLKTQTFSVDDVRKMQNQKERIMDSIERVSNSKQAYNKAKWEREMEFSNLLEQLEALVIKYNSEGKELALIPESAKNAQGKRFLIEIDKANAHEVDQSKFLGGVDVQNAAKKSISELKTKYVEQTAEVKREFLELQDKLESSKKLSKELLDGIDIFTGKQAKHEEGLNREIEDQESILKIRLKEVESVETMVSAMRDPVSLEEAITKNQRKCAELEVLRLQYQQDSILRKRAVHDEIENAIRLCHDHTEYQQKKVLELDSFIQDSKNNLDHVVDPNFRGSSNE
eukprot:scaffold237949_cov54-Attheya_sp.AAC.9